MSKPSIRPRRSVLYMPGSNPRALEKARTLPTDAVILDLEDAVAPDAKDLARHQVVEAIRQGGFGNREVVARINAFETPWGEADLAALAAAGPDAILVPKISAPATIIRVAAALHGRASERTRIWAMMETPMAVLAAPAIAAAAADPANRFDCLVMGTNDLAKDTRARLVPGRAPMLPWLQICVAAARAYGIDVIDGVYNGLEDDAGLRAECEQGRDLGFDGKTLIHPRQIACANAVFAPSDEEVRWARAILDAFALPEHRGKGVISLEGRMVERLHADMARRTVAIAQAIAAATP